MSKIDLNKLAVTITQKEGKKINLSIAQVKEVLRLVLLELSHMSLSDVVGLLHRFLRSPIKK